MTPRRLLLLALSIAIAIGAAIALWPSESDEAQQVRAPAARPRKLPRRPPRVVVPDELEAAPAFIEGRVEDPAHRRVAGARVVLDLFEGGDTEPPEPVVVTSGPDGSFRFDVPQDGRYLVVAEHPRFTPGGWSGPLVVHDGNVPEGLVVVVLGNAASLTVRVVDPRGSPVSGATVEVSGLGAMLETDTRGEALWTALRPVGPVLVRVHASGYAPAVEGVRLASGVAAELTIQLEAGRELSGRVLDGGRHPVPGARVRVLGGPHAPHIAEVMTDEAGEFSLVDLPGDQVVLVADHPEYAPSEFTRVEPEQRTVELVLMNPASLSGWVRGRDRRLIPGATVQLEGPRGSSDGMRTDDEGAFAFTGLAPGEYQVVARFGPDAGRRTITLEPGRALDRVEVTLTGPFSVQGVVVARFTREPIPGASVAARLVSGTGGAAPAAVTTDEEGRFVLTGLTMDVARLDVRALGFVTERQPLALTGQDLDVGEIGLEPRIFGGVGMTLSVDDGAVRVQGVFDGAPAGLAGLVAGDVILEIDGERVDGLELEDVVGRIRGSEGSDVRMLVRRSGEAEPIRVDMTRATIDPERLEREREGR